MATRRPEAAGDRTARPHGAGSSLRPHFQQQIPNPRNLPDPTPLLAGEARRVFPPGPSLPDQPSGDERWTERRRSRFSASPRAFFREARRVPPKIGGRVDFNRQLAGESKAAILIIEWVK